MSLAGKRILLTGDSHMDWSPFGVTLDRLLREAGAVVTRKAIGGSSAKQWASGKPVCRTIDGNKVCFSADDLRAAGPYDLVVVSLGTNDAANASAANADRGPAAEQAANDVEKFMGLLGSPRFVVVGPPLMKDSTAHYTNANMTPLVDVFTRRFSGRYIDSRSVPKIDGDSVHMGRKGGETWAQLVAARLPSLAGGGSSSLTGVLLALVAGAAVVAYRRRR